MLAALQNRTLKKSPGSQFAQTNELFQKDDKDGFQRLYDEQKNTTEFLKMVEPSSGNNLLHAALDSQAIATVDLIVELAANNGVLKDLLLSQNKAMKSAYEGMLSRITPAKDKQMNPSVMHAVKASFEMTDYQINFVCCCVATESIEWVRALLDFIPEKCAPQVLSFALSEQMFRLILDHWKESKILKENLSGLLACAAGTYHELYRNLGSIDSFTFLLDIAGCDINAKIEDDGTPLHFLLQNGTATENTLETFFKKGARVDVFNKYGLTPVHEVVLNGNKRLLELTLKYFPDFDLNMQAPEDIRQGYIATLLDCAVAANDSELSQKEAIIDLLFEKGAKILATSPCVALVCSKRLCNIRGLPYLKKLLEKGADPNVRVKDPTIEHPRLWLFNSAGKIDYTSALGGMAYFYDEHKLPQAEQIYDKISTEEAEEKIQLLLRHGATLAPHEMRYHLGMGPIGFRATQLAEEQAKREENHKIEVREKQQMGWIFEQHIFSHMVPYLDGITFKNILQTCTQSQKVDTSENWMHLVTRDFPGEELRVAPKNWKYRYAFLQSAGGMPAIKPAKKLTGEWKPQGKGYDFTLSLTNDTFQFTFNAQTHNMTEIDIYNGPISKLPGGKGLVLKCDKISRTSYTEGYFGGGGSWTEDKLCTFIFCAIDSDCSTAQLRDLSNCKHMPFPFLQLTKTT